jgi:hypothetical protein
MARLSRDLLLGVLRQPAQLHSLTTPEWELLVRQARRADLLARLGCLAAAAGATSMPRGASEHLHAAAVLAQAQRDEVRREAEFLACALAPLDVRVTLMKGAAYLMSGRSAAQGRLFSDIDIMVPKPRLPEVEAALMQHGWATTHHSLYDQRYYRQWMHELPPMQHIHRHTVVDVHHAILPDTARLKPDPLRLLAAAEPLPDDARLQVLAPVDMVLHSMTHLFHNEEMSHGLRDLSDLDLLLREFASDAAFWPALVDRACELDLLRPLHYGLGHAHELLGTPVPPDTLAATAAAAPRWPLSLLMKCLWRRGLRAPHASAALRFTPLALFALYVRAHWLRMPPWMLTRHLCVKALGLGRGPRMNHP